jgi:hypothetical protein
MVDFFKILGVFIIIIFLLRRRWNLGNAVLAATLALIPLFWIPPQKALMATYNALVAPASVELLAALALIMVLEYILRNSGTFELMVGSLQAVVSDRRVVMAILPAVLGFLPSAGGAVFSAPMVETAAASMNLKNSHKSFINYWFRHIWEYIFPLYPGVLLTAALTQTHVGQVFKAQFPLSLAAIAGGAFFGLRGIAKASNHKPLFTQNPSWEGKVQGLEDMELSSVSEKAPPEAREGKFSDRRLGNITPPSSSYIKNLGYLLVSFSPIGGVILLVLVFKINLALAIGLVILALALYFRYGPQKFFRAVKESLSFKTIFMVAIILIFKEMLEASGAVKTIPLFFASLGIPKLLVFFALPFFVGLLTGITVAFVGATFPILLSMMDGQVNLYLLTFGYASGFAGLMLSPVHLCFVLTNEYFHTDTPPVYRRMLLPLCLVLLVGLGVAWVHQ